MEDGGRWDWGSREGKGYLDEESLLFFIFFPQATEYEHANGQVYISL